MSKAHHIFNIEQVYTPTNELYSKRAKHDFQFYPKKSTWNEINYKMQNTILDIIPQKKIKNHLTHH